MRERKLIEEEIRESKRILEKLEGELADHEKVLEPKTLPLNNKISELKKSKWQIEQPKPSPLFTIGAVAFIAVAVLNWLVFKQSSVITLASVALAIGIWIAKAIVNSVINKPFKAAQANIDNEISAINDQIAGIRATDPEIGKLESEIGTKNSRIQILERELKEVKINEKIGTNNLIVSLNNSGGYYDYIDSNAKFQSVHRYILNITVDGKNMGNVAEPCTIIPLGAGIHSVTAEFVPITNDVTFQISNIQFSLKDNNNFLSFKAPKYTLSKKVFDVDQKMSRDLGGFFLHSGVSESDFESYVNRL